MNEGYKQGIDLFENILSLSLDKLINKILKYLADLPIKYSFFQLIPVYNQLF